MTDQEELELLRNFATLVEPFVRHWPLAGAGPEAMEAFALLMKWRGEKVEPMQEAAEAASEFTTEAIAAWVEEKWIRRFAPQARDRFLEELRAGEFMK